MQVPRLGARPTRKGESEKPAGALAITALQALRSRTILLLASLTFLNYFMAYSFMFWFPTMLKRQSGLSDAHVGLYGAVPYLVAFLAMQANGWHSDRRCERRWHSAIPLFIAASGALGLISQPGSFSLVWFTMVCLGFAYLPSFWAIPTELLSQSAAAAAVGLINAVGSFAGFAGPYIFGYLITLTGSFSYGLAAMTIAGAAGGLLILCAPRSPRT